MGLPQLSGYSSRSGSHRSQLSQRCVDSRTFFFNKPLLFSLLLLAFALHKYSSAACHVLYIYHRTTERPGQVKDLLHACSLHTLQAGWKVNRSNSFCCCFCRFVNDVTRRHAIPVLPPRMRIASCRLIIARASSVVELPFPVFPIPVSLPSVPLSYSAYIPILPYFKYTSRRREVDWLVQNASYQVCEGKITFLVLCSSIPYPCPLPPSPPHPSHPSVNGQINVFAVRASDIATLRRLAWIKRLRLMINWLITS